MAEMMNDQQFVEYVVKAIVDDTDAVRTTREVDDRGVLITLYVAKDDMGKIIGRAGKTVAAIRTLLRVVGSKNESSAEQRVNLKIYDPEGTSGLMNSDGDIDL
ncbi:MAG: KH domain-containing protein [Patescibacteria group bacterium]|nr:KH domain-containing protein [Patescibacteria group bacterium]